MTASQKVRLPFDRPFDKPFDKLTVLSKAEGLTVLSKVEGLMALCKAEGPFDMLTALSRVEGLRCATSFVTAAYFSVRLIPQDLRALHLDLFSLPSDFDFLQSRQSSL